MSCRNPRCVVIPYRGGRPIYGLVCSDRPAGSDYNRIGYVSYLPCGKCLECLISRRQDLTALQIAEGSLSDYDNWFLTLTYSDDHLRYGLDKYDNFVPVLFREDVQRFVKNLGSRLSRKGIKFRYFGCGEYGEVSKRPHYHLSLFNLSPSDLCLEVVDNLAFTSSVISELWTYGHHQIYRATNETFQYVAGYVTKKLQLSKSDKLYGITPEFLIYPKPSIGRAWYDKYQDLLIRDGCFNVGGRSWRIPQIFHKWLRQDRPYDDICKLQDFNDFVLPDREDLKRKSAYSDYKQKEINKVREV